MKIMFSIVTLGFLLSFTYPPLDTVDQLDLEKYMGTWHQIATIPASFQEKCVRKTSAEYKRLDKNHVQVINRCEEEDGEVRIAIGRARINCDFKNPSRLQVTFVKLFNWWVWSFGGDYWVIDLDADYNYSVVGDRKRFYLWILSRSAAMEISDLKILEEKIKDQHFDTCDIVITQEGELKGKRLCDISFG
ncbi:MAG: lipocalin family protein [Oligoflexales bacterium]